MKTNLKLATVACATVVGLGVIGCGGSGGTPPPPPPPPPPPVVGVPAYATPVDVNETTARKVLHFLYDGGFVAHSVTAAAASKSPLALETVESAIGGPRSFQDILFSLFENIFQFIHIGVGSPDKVKAKTSFGMAPTDTESGETNITMDCSVSGTFTLEKKWGWSDGPGAGEEYFSMKVTFDQCVHNTALFEDIMNHLTPDDYQYTYNGSFGFDAEWKDLGVVGMDSVAFDADHLTERVTNSGINAMAFDMNAKGKLKAEGGHGYNKFAFDMNGTAGGEDFDENGTSTGKGVFEVEAFSMMSKQARSGDLRRQELNIDGYIGMEETNSTGDVEKMYIYGKDAVQKSVKDYSPAVGHMTTNFYSGTLGLPCISGAVDLATPVVWDTNSTQTDVSAPSNTGRTPFIGTTTISGANSTVATVNFDENSASPKESFGTITVDGGAPSAAQGLPDMGVECDMTLINP